MEKLVYIVLINYNSIKHTEECVRSLINIKYTNYKIVIVDNNSKADNLDNLSKVSNVTIIKNNKNSGFAGANNIGIKYSLKNNADYILLLNNDTAVNPYFLKILVNESEKDEAIGISTGKILYYYDKNRIWYGGGHVSYFKGNAQVEHLNEINSCEDSNRYCEFSSGCCMLIKTEALKKVGLMSEKYFLYYEDGDYSLKYINNDYKIRYCPEAIIYHKESVTTGKFSSNYQYYFARNRLIFIKDNLKFKNKITAYPVTILWLLYKIILGVFNFSPCILGVKDFIRRKYGRREEGVVS